MSSYLTYEFYVGSKTIAWKKTFSEPSSHFVLEPRNRNYDREAYSLIFPYARIVLHDSHMLVPAIANAIQIEICHIKNTFYEYFRFESGGS